MTYCKQCLEKQRKIDELQEEIVRLKAKLRYQERTTEEGFFGSSTPSSKIPIKANRHGEEPRPHGGGKVGHPGHGRQRIDAEQADRVERIAVGGVCPDCGGPLEAKGSKSRTVIDCQPVRIQRVVYRLERKRCPHCRRLFTARPPGVLAKCLYSNQLLAHVVVEHYVYGRTLGQIEKQTGVGYSSLVDALHQLSERLKEVPKALIQAYRRALVKHADETGWRTEGRNGYAWLFCTPDLSLYRFRRTRSASVAHEVFGDKPLRGVLVVDRYNGYNRVPCSLQYCYAHLLREVQDLDKEFPENAEVHNFVEALAPLLANAIHLRGLGLAPRQFKREARKIKNQILQMVNRPARHPAIQTMQDLFRQKADRLYHWADDPQIPADNNRAERELRPLVIARKISFGSQSDAGARTRETLMTVLLTLAKKTPDVMAAFKSILDQLAEQPEADPAKLLLRFNSS
jgi:transposase-like protein